MEKVLPFYGSSLSAEEEKQVEEKLNAPLSEPWAEVHTLYV